MIARANEARMTAPSESGSPSFDASPFLSLMSPEWNCREGYVLLFNALTIVTCVSPPLRLPGGALSYRIYRSIDKRKVNLKRTRKE